MSAAVFATDTTTEVRVDTLEATNHACMPDVCHNREVRI